MFQQTKTLDVRLKMEKLELNSTFRFISIEEKPQLKTDQSLVVVATALVILVSGLLIQNRSYLLLARRKSDNSSVLIEKLFLSNCCVCLICYPPVLIYFMVNALVFPMSDYIGTVGCLIVMHLLDVFVRFYNLFFPVTVALLRYLFAVQHQWVKRFGMKNAVNRIIFLSIVGPLLMNLSLQFPISDFIHGPFNHCIGRFEVYFNPTHPDPLTPGRRKGEQHCSAINSWRDQPDIGEIEKVFFFLLQVSCYFTRVLFGLLTCCIPEMILYPIIFCKIRENHKRIALSGILKPEVLQRRKQKNALNIIITFWAFIAQFVSNLIYIFGYLFLFGNVKFYHSLLAVVTVSLNFNILPFFYIFVADDEVKTAILSREFLKILFLFFKG